MTDAVSAVAGSRGAFVGVCAGVCVFVCKSVCLSVISLSFGFVRLINCHFDYSLTLIFSLSSILHNYSSIDHSEFVVFLQKSTVTHSQLKFASLPQ